ncbi:alpha/beta fold hydrolase [Actinokineospora soli]|uniref:Alpha/beta fold hydrolase n=1 Tax=Actinokineospora soli TaxID=1048753 RepID=A0ABW2TLW9_9PSEU
MKRALVVLATAVVAGAGLAGPVSASPALGWGPCPEDAAVECASLTVPVDWDRPTAGTIEVRVARKRATGDRIGTLFFLPGGPGGSGVGAVLTRAPLSAEIAARFDVVGIDPRGTNRSSPVVCDADLADLPAGVPDTGARLVDVAASARRLGRDCRARTGPLLDHVDSAAVARDLDALRAALGERQVSVYGISYGTLAGQMYAELFPRRVRAMVLDSVFDHSLSTRDFLTSEARAAEETFGQFVAWCDREPSCALHGRDVRRVYTDLYAEAVRGELHVPGDPAAPIGPMDLIGIAVGHQYGPAWNQLAGLLAAMAGGTAPVALQAAEVVEFPMAVFCADHDFRFSSQRDWADAWREVQRDAPTVGGHFAWSAASACASWPARTGNPQHRTDVDGGPAILLMNSRYDPATPLEWARGVERQIDRSVLLTYDGWGHNVHARGSA